MIDGRKQINMSTLRITGRGVCARPADRTELHLTVRRVKETCAAASEAADAAVRTLCARLRERGFDESGLRTTAFDISPEYEQMTENGLHRRVQTGYACRISLRFALPFTPEALSLAVDALAEGTEELSISFSVADAEAVRREVVRAAWKDALSQAALFAEMQRRYSAVHKAVSRHSGESVITPYPFNSGYFMSFDTTGHSAEELRCYLLEKYGVGAINIFDRTFRVAYCSVEPEKIKDLVALIYKAAEELWS